MKSLFKVIFATILVLLSISLFVAPFVYVFVGVEYPIPNSKIIMIMLGSVLVILVGIIPLFVVKQLVDDFVGFVSNIVAIVIIIASLAGGIYFTYRGIAAQNYWWFWLSLPCIYIFFGCVSKVIGIILSALGFMAVVMFLIIPSLWELWLPVCIVSGIAMYMYHPEEAVEDIKNKDNKEASVVKRAIVGGFIAGGAGAVVGALSAIDHNNRNSKK